MLNGTVRTKKLYNNANYIQTEKLNNIQLTSKIKFIVNVVALILLPDNNCDHPSIFLDILIKLSKIFCGRLCQKSGKMFKILREFPINNECETFPHVN